MLTETHCILCGAVKVWTWSCLVEGPANNAATEATGNEVRHKCSTLMIPF